MHRNLFSYTEAMQSKTKPKKAKQFSFMFCKFHWDSLSKRRYSISIPGNKDIENKKVPLKICYSVAQQFSLLIFSFSHISSDSHSLSCVLLPRICWILFKEGEKDSHSNQSIQISQTLFLQSIHSASNHCLPTVCGHALGTQQTQMLVRKLLLSWCSSLSRGGAHANA